MLWHETGPVIETHGRFKVVREDLLEGGSKTRFLPALIDDSAEELVFGGPFCGGAPVALSVVGREMGRRVTIFYAKRAELHERQKTVLRNGGTIYQVPFGYMTNVQAKARAYAKSVGAQMLPLGFDLPEAERPFVAVMRQVREVVGDPEQIWCASGSGMLARCLAKAFPDSSICAVAVGLASRWGRQTMPENVEILEHRLRFEQQCKADAPFPCCRNYDRKAWEMAQKLAKGKNLLFWNVLGSPD